MNPLKMFWQFVSPAKEIDHSKAKFDIAYTRFMQQMCHVEALTNDVPDHIRRDDVLLQVGNAEKAGAATASKTDV